MRIRHVGEHALGSLLFRSGTSLGATACLLVATTAHGQVAESVATLRELGPALTRCFRAPEHTQGFAITLRFSLGSRGAMIGRPIVTASSLPGTPEEKRDFVDAAFQAIAACTPVPVTPSLGAAIAGRPLSVRFLGNLAARTI